MNDSEPDINKILAHMALIKYEDVSTRTLNMIRKAWTKSTLRTGFTPTPEEANRLKTISQNHTYKAFKECVGSFQYTRFIKVGLLLYDLKCAGDKSRIDQIRKDIKNSKYSDPNAFKILHIASTGVLLHVLNYVVDMKDRDHLSPHAVRQEFLRILELWTEISISVTKDDAPADVEKKILGMMKTSPPLMFIYAGRKHLEDGAARYRSTFRDPVINAQRAIANLRNRGVFRDAYVMWSKMLIYETLEQYLCVFYSVRHDLNTAFG